MTTLSPTDKDPNVSLSPDLLTATIGASNTGVRSSTSKTTGNVAVEMTVGVAGYIGGGICNANMPLDTWLENNGTHSAGAYRDGNYAYDGALIGTGISFGNPGDVVMLCFALAARTLKWGVNGGPFTPDLAWPKLPAGGPFFFILTGADGGEVGTANFGGTPFTNVLPATYSAWDGAAPASADSLILPRARRFTHLIRR